MCVGACASHLTPPSPCASEEEGSLHTQEFPEESDPDLDDAEAEESEAPSDSEEEFERQIEEHAHLFQDDDGS